MADTKISALTAASSAQTGQELPINESGATKKLTTDQVKTFVNSAPDFVGGGTGAGTWPSVASGSLLTTPEAGAWEYDGDAHYLTATASNRAVVRAENIICLSASYTLTSQTAAQKLFNASTNGALTLPTGTYFFECLFSLSSMSGTSGNAAFQILGGGTATVGTVLYHAVGIDGNINAAATQTGSTSNASSSVASIVTAGTNTNMHTSIRGTFRVTGAGTIIPSVALVTAAAAIVAAGSYFRCYKVGASNFATVGNWS